MFVTKMNSVLAGVLVVATLASAVVMIYPTQAAEPPTDAQKKGEEKPVRGQSTPQPAKTDQARMVGNWFIVNEDSLRQGEMWVITADSILMHAKNLGANAHHYAHRLDASKNPKQIDITIARVNGPTVGVIKGIYVLDEDELRLCLGEMGKDRPAAFPEKRKPGEVLVLQRETWGAMPPTAQNAQPEQSVLTPDDAIQQMPKGNVTVQFKVAKVDAMHNPAGGFGGPVYYIFLSDGAKFTARMAKTADQIMKLGIDPVKHFTGKVVRVTGRVERVSESSFQMWVREITDIEVMDRAF